MRVIVTGNVNNTLHDLGPDIHKLKRTSLIAECQDGSTVKIMPVWSSPERFYGMEITDYDFEYIEPRQAESMIRIETILKTRIRNKRES